MWDIADDVAELWAAGADAVAVDDVAAKRDSTILARTVDTLQTGDVLVVSTGARLAPSVGQFLATLADLARRGVRVRVLDEPALSMGDRMVDPGEVFLALDRVKRALISEQTRRGMALAAREGRRPGRPPVMTAEMTAIARELRAQDRTLAHIARVLRVSPGAVARALKQSSGSVT